MTQLILFLLATTGFTILIVKSKLFKRPRIFFAELYEKRKDKKGIFTWIIWLIDSVINCYMCFSVYGGAICYILMLYNCNLLLYVLSGVPVVTLLVAQYDKICRS